MRPRPERPGRHHGVALGLGLVALCFVAPLGGAQDAELVVVLGGDVIFDNPIDYALRRTDRSRDEPASYAPLFEDIAPALGAADLSVVNLETPVAERAFRSAEGEPPRFAAPGAFLAALAAAGVDAVTVANNHAYDQGVAGLAQTLSALDAIGLPHAGADPSGAARIVEVGGRRVALLAFAEGTNFRPLDEEPATPRIAVLERERVRAAVTAARAQADFVAIALHWTEGREHVPSPRMRRYARAAADAGADLVWGHGTHLPAGTSVVRTDDGRSVPVIWSLGNLVAVMEASDEVVHGEAPSVRDAWLARVALGASGGRLSVRSIGAMPFWIGLSEREGAAPFVRPLALGPERAALEARTDCARCLRLARSYARRAARARELLTLAAPEAAVEDAELRLAASEVSTPDEEEVRAGTGEAPHHDDALVALAEPPAPAEPPGRAAEPPDDGGRGRTLVSVARAEPSDAPGPVERPARPARPASREVVDRVSLAIEWSGDRALEAEVDREELAALAARLRSDFGLRLVIVAHPRGAADRSLWVRRASRARGLVAILGPSRSRISHEVGAPEPTPRLEALLVR